MRFAELKEILGHEAAERLCEFAGGDRIYVPLPPGGIAGRVLTLRRSGLSTRAIAARVGRSARRIQQILAEAKYFA